MLFQTHNTMGIKQTYLDYSQSPDFLGILGSRFLGRFVGGKYDVFDMGQKRKQQRDKMSKISHDWAVKSS